MTEKEANPSVEASDANRKRQVSDFIIGDVVGNGSFSKVIVAKEKSSGLLFAIKVIKKDLILKLQKREIVFRERSILTKLRHQTFFVQLLYSFQDPRHLYFVMSYARRGELLRYINALHGFNCETTRFYTSELIAALETIHSLNIIHRDLKPENILVGEDYHIMVTDFGTSKLLEEDTENKEYELKRTSSFVGTAQFVSPELLTDKQICKSSDLWSLGVTIFQMVTTDWPFKGVSEYYMFDNIRNLNYEIPPIFPDACKDLVSKLIVLDPYKRLGDSHTGGYPALKAHPLFRNVEWDSLTSQRPPAQMTMCSLDLLPTVENEFF